MKDIRLIVKAKNNRMIAFRESKGLSQSQMAELCGMSPSLYGEIENLKKYPICRGRWSEAANNISSATGLSEEELFPKAFELMRANTSHLEIGILELPNYAQPLFLESPEIELGRTMMKENLKRSLSTLTPREEEVIRRRFGIDGPEETLEEIANDKYLLRERIRTIEKQALRKLRHPARSKLLKEDAEYAMDAS